jgi:hypothetical protein
MQHEREMVLLTFIGYEGRCDYIDKVSQSQAWFVPAVRTKPKYVENPTAKHFREIEEMKRYNQAEQRKAGKWFASKDAFFRERPHLDAYMTDAWWEDGKPRDTCSLTVRAGATGAVLSLNDAENEQSISTNGESVTDALDRLEAYLGAGNPTWRPWGKKKR